ncbi:MAG TPA: spermidine/putrescine ABC transporter ATP-binding protein, partial [Agrobacterium sp.]|nr:spermidine/putrescine ABC transporter ATP-binding protein [Agrobacterium sp.]
STLSFDMFNDPGTAPPALGEQVTLKFAAGDLMVIKD